MACDITAGRNRACKTSLGGNSVIYLYPELADSFTVVAGECTAMSSSLTVAYKFELEGDLNIFTESMPSDRNTFSRVNTQTLSIVLKVQDVASNAQLNLLSASFGHAVIADRNLNHKVVGLTDGIDWSIEATTGGSKTDGNLYTLTGVSTENVLAPTLDSATQAAFLAVVA